MARLDVATIPVAYAGLDTESAPDRTYEGCAPEHANFLVHHDGEMPMRGPLVGHDELPMGDSPMVAGAWHFGTKSLFSFVAASESSTVEPQVAPYKRASDPDVLADPTQHVYLVDHEAMTSTEIDCPVQRVPTGRGARLGQYMYGFAYSSANDPVLMDGGYQRQRRFLRWTGSTTPPVTYVNAPRNGQDIITHYNRLFILGGQDTPAGSSVQEANALFYSDLGWEGADNVQSWRNDVSGLTNKIIVGDNNPDDFGVALARAGQNLVIFKRHSIHILYGYSDDTFNLRTISTDIGCLDARSVVEHGDGVYFLSAEGYMFLDGATITNASQTILSEMTEAAQTSVGTLGQPGGAAVATRLPNHYILLTLYSVNMTTGELEGDSKSYLFHCPTERWTRFSSDATADPIPRYVTRSLAAGGMLFDGVRVVKADYLTMPEAAPESARGYDEVDGSAVIPALWRSSLVNLGTPAYMSQIHRAFVDYRTRLYDGADNEDNGFVVEWLNGDGTPVANQYPLPNMGDASRYLYRRRHVHDAFNEASDVQLIIRSDTPAGGVVPLQEAVLFDCFIEYQITRQRRST